jgi:hypothetical protein
MENDEYSLYLCYFENGFENDIFFEREIGQQSLDKMSLTRFELDKDVYDLRISSLNHLFAEFHNDVSYYKSKLTVKKLIN